MLAGMPTLEELYSEGISLLTGNIKSLRVLKDRLEKVDFSFCFYVEGNFMDLAGFLLLMELNFDTIAVRVDIRDIRDIDWMYRKKRTSSFFWRTFSKKRGRF